MTRYPRLRMRQTLREQDTSSTWQARAIQQSDATALGALMVAAYRGTADDEGESEADAVAEVERTLAGDYGPLLEDCSFAAHEGSRIVGASMVTLWEGDPFLTYVVVHPDMKRRGLGTFLMTTSGNALVTAGYSQLDLFVTEENEPAVTLYRKLGFQVVDRLTHLSIES
jgi:ribosomal protein S18 acetylase RimI-like enzyme